MIFGKLLCFLCLRIMRTGFRMTVFVKFFNNTARVHLPIQKFIRLRFFPCIFHVQWNFYSHGHFARCYETYLGQYTELWYINDIRIRFNRNYGYRTVLLGTVVSSKWNYLFHFELTAVPNKTVLQEHVILHTNLIQIILPEIRTYKNRMISFVAVNIQYNCFLLLNSF